MTSLHSPSQFLILQASVCLPFTFDIVISACPRGEIQCLDGRCLPYHLICHTEKRCRVLDEEYCSTDTGQGLSVSAIAAIVSASIVVCVLLILLFYLLYLRRHRDNTSRESQAGNYTCHNYVRHVDFGNNETTNRFSFKIALSKCAQV